MSFLFSFILLVLFIGLILLMFLLGIVRSIFGIGRRNNTQYNNTKEDQIQSSNNTKNKIFDKDDGEYVDFEELD